ncbi:hypothetical protein ACFLQ6_01480 [Thermoproteota archaeon]
MAYVIYRFDILKYYAIYLIYRWYIALSNSRLIQCHHPNQDGNNRKESFFQLLESAISVSSQKKGRVELVEIQRALLKKGWHPWR